ncbi:MAG: hypothetical protein QXN71_01690 [Candidatus Aenigmatarchaeota archaeon]
MRFPKECSENCPVCEEIEAYTERMGYLSLSDSFVSEQVINFCSRCVYGISSVIYEYSREAEIIKNLIESSHNRDALIQKIRDMGFPEPERVADEIASDLLEEISVFSEYDNRD